MIEIDDNHVLLGGRGGGRFGSSAEGMMQTLGVTPHSRIVQSSIVNSELSWRVADGKKCQCWYGGLNG